MTVRKLEKVAWGSMGLLVALIVLRFILATTTRLPGPIGHVGQTATRWSGLNP